MSLNIINGNEDSLLLFASVICSLSVPIILTFAEVATSNTQVENSVARLVHRIHILAYHDSIFRSIIFLYHVSKDILHNSNHLIFPNPCVNLRFHICEVNKNQKKEICQLLKKSVLLFKMPLS